MDSFEYLQSKGLLFRKVFLFLVVFIVGMIFLIPISII